MRRTLITAVLAIALLVSCGSDSTPSEPPEPRSVDVSDSNDGISIRRIYMEGEDLPLTCVVYNKTGGSDFSDKYGQGSGISCDWVGFNSGWLAP